MSVKRCQREVDSAEFSEWLAYSIVNPFGQVRGDMQAGLIACQLANIYRSEDTEPYKVSDFLLQFDKPGKKKAKKPKFNDSPVAQNLLFALARKINSNG